MVHKDTDKNTQDDAVSKDDKKDTSSVSESETKTPIDAKPESSEEFIVSHKPQNQEQSRSVLVFILTIAFALILGILVFSYIYDLAGIRSFSNYYGTSDKVSQSTTTSTVKKSSDNHGDDDLDDDLNASKQVQDIQNNESHDITETPVSKDNDTSELSDTKKLASNFLELEKKLSQSDDLSMPNITTNVNYQQELSRLKREFKVISRQFLVLNEKLMRGETYLDVLIDLKTQLRTQKIDTPMLTEYASGGFPTDMIIVTDALKLLKKLAIIESRQKSSNSVFGIINKFIVITPQTGAQGFFGTYHKISKALDSGDFDIVSELIYQLSPEKQKSLRDLQAIISDKKAVHSELKKLNDAIINNIFVQSE